MLPSPNGSTHTLLASGSSLVHCGCLRNASAVAEATRNYQKIGVVPAGEKWSDGSLRPALEDWLGAGAIIFNLPGSWSPEAKAAVSAFETQRTELLQAMKTCPSGVELLDGGYDEDVELAGQLDSSTAVPQFDSPVYRG